MSELFRIFTWQMVWIDQWFFRHWKWSELISNFLDIENGLNWSQFSHSKWIDLIMILTRNMVWIDKGLRWEMVWIIMSLTNSLKWSGFLHGKCFWIDQDFCMANGLNWSHILNVKWYELFTIFICEMVWIDQVFYMGNGLNWSEGLHGKWSELIRFFTWKIVWIDQEVYIANGVDL